MEDTTTQVQITCQVKVPEKCSVTQTRSSLLFADSRIQVPNVSVTFSTCVAFPMEVIMDSTKGGEKKVAHLPIMTLRHPISEFRNRMLCFCTRLWGMVFIDFLIGFSHQGIVIGDSTCLT